MKQRNWREMAEGQTIAAGKTVHTIDPGGETFTASQALDHVAMWLGEHGNHVPKDTLARVMKVEFGRYDLDLETRVTKMGVVSGTRSSHVRFTSQNQSNDTAERLRWDSYHGKDPRVPKAVQAKYPNLSHAAVLQVEEGKAMYYFCIVLKPGVSGESMELIMLRKHELIPQSNGQQNGQTTQQSAAAI